MREELLDIRQKLSHNKFENEEQVRFSLVSRILQNLEWDIFNPEEVKTEHKASPSEDSTKVDLALFLNPYSPAIFIEVKTPGKVETDLERTEIQLRDYNKNFSAQFCLITDGDNWRFYFPQTDGRFKDKCFKKISILGDDPETIEKTFQTFLGKTPIKNGSAKDEAEKYVRLSRKQKVMEDSYYRAKKLTEEDPYPSLPEALVKVIEEQGIDITEGEVKNFLKHFREKTFKDENKPAPTQSYDNTTVNENRKNDTPKNKDDSKSRKKTKQSILVVKFPDGTTLNYSKVRRTFCEAIEKIGPEKVQNLNIKVNKYDLVSQSEGYYTQHPIKHGFLVMTQTPTPKKKHLLDEISNRLNLGLTTLIQTE